jgi:predicted acyl esterase
VKLIDVYPEDMPNDPQMGGYEFMVSNEVLRGRYRKSYEHPEAIAPNQTTEFKYSLHTQSYRFLKGHKIMVQVQSSWFPIIDRNPQTYVPNINTAKASDFKPATMSVYRSKDLATHLTLPVWPSAPCRRVSWAWARRGVIAAIVDHD